MDKSNSINTTRNIVTCNFEEKRMSFPNFG